MKVWLKAATCVVGIGLPLLCGCSSAPSGTGSFKLTKSQISRFGNKQEIVTRNSDRCVDKSGGITYNLMSCGGVAIDGYQSIIDEIVIIKNSAIIYLSEQTQCANRSFDRPAFIGKIYRKARTTVSLTSAKSSSVLIRGSPRSTFGSVYAKIGSKSIRMVESREI